MPDQPFSVDRPLPEGVRDLLFADAATLRGMAASLRATWNAWGYREIILPTFEYAATLSTDVGAGLDAEMYRFFDRHGRTLALRPDMTIPTARVVGTRLYDQPKPLRLSYIGSVFRYEPPRAGRQHEFIQAGVELIGARGATADAESIALAVAALRAIGLPAFRITLGHVGFFRGLLLALAAPERLAARLRSAVDRKAEAELAALLQEVPRPAPGVREAALALPRLTGGPEVLAEAEALCVNASMEVALADLRAVAELLAAYGVTDAISYDLAEVRDLDYYTGVTFEGFAPGLGFNLISGGRYDDLIGHFGPPCPAVGWALTLDRILLAREMQGVASQMPVSDVLLSARGCIECLSWAAEARRRGLNVEVDPLELEPEALWQAAARTAHPAHGDPSGCGHVDRARRRGAAPDRGRRLGGGGAMAEPMMPGAPLTIALPKGRLAEDALAFLKRAGYAPPANGDGSRKLILDGADGRLRFVMVKPGDVPTFVEYGAADLGIAGLDVVREAERDVYEPLQLPFGYCRLVVCGRAEHADRSLWLERSPRVATKFPRLTEAYFRRRGLAPELIVMSGSVELAPLVGLTDLIVDLVQTGATLRENGLVELRTILESQAVLIANRASYRLRAEKCAS